MIEWPSKGTPLPASSARQPTAGPRGGAGRGCGGGGGQTKLREMLLELTVLVRIRHPNVVTFWGTATHFPGPDDAAQDPFIGLVFELCKAASLCLCLSVCLSPLPSVPPLHRARLRALQGRQSLPLSVCLAVSPSLPPSPSSASSSSSARQPERGAG